MPFASRACLVLGLVLLGCGKSEAIEVGTDEGFAMETTPASVEPADPSETEAFGAGPWIGRLERTTHRYSNGCTDHRTVGLLALVRGDKKTPIIVGVGRLSPKHREEPRFLRNEEQLPAAARGASCVLISGKVVTYAHQGIAGAPAYAIAPSQIDPVRCP